MGAITKLLKVTLIVHIVLAVLFGLPLLGMPVRFLVFFGWAPVDPLLSCILGAALLGFGWLDLRTLRGNSRQAAQPVIEAGTVFCGLASAGLFWHVLGSYWPWMVWIVLATFIILAVLWVVNWIANKSDK
jgi:hypothetical protein